MIFSQMIFDLTAKQTHHYSVVTFFLTDEIREVKTQNKQLNKKLIELQKTLDEMKCEAEEN